MRNLLTDVDGIRVGNAEDTEISTGVTVVLPDEPAVTVFDARGGGTGTRDVEVLGPDSTVQEAHGIVLSGGSAFGLDAAGGVQAWLAERGIGFHVREAVVPIVPQAILFDLLNGGRKDWGDTPPYRALARRACETASVDFALGNVGAGHGAVAGGLKGGLGSASVYDAVTGATVAALAAVNSVGSVLFPESAAFLAWDAERDQEFGGRPPPFDFPRGRVEMPKQAQPGENTTLAVVATDAILDKSQARRVAIMAQDGFARAIRPVHSPLDGDVVFMISTGRVPLADPVLGLAHLGTHAADCVARAIARGVFEAESLGPHIGYRERYPA